MGYQVFELIDEDPSAELLSRTEILFVNDYQVLTDYSSDSKTAIDDWVASGGSLIFASQDIFGLDFGFKMYTYSGQGGGLYDNDSYVIYPHPVTIGVTDFEVPHATGASTFIFSDPVTVVISTTSDSNSPNSPIIVTSNYFDGKVMGCAASAPWVNAEFNKNKELIKNFIDWTTINTTLPDPWISSPDDVTYDEGSTGNTITWTMGGMYPYYYQIFLDEVVYQSGSWSSYPLTINVDGLFSGTYDFTIHIYDHYGRTAMDTVEVVVNELEDTTTTTTTEMTTGELSSELSTAPRPTPYSFFAMLSGLVFLGFLVTYKRRKQ